MFEGLILENADTCYGHLEYITDIGIFYDHLAHFVFIWYIFPVLVSCDCQFLLGRINDLF
jgi:hypothetical protein